MLFVSVASKGLSLSVSGLESILAGCLTSVASKRVTDAFFASCGHLLASVDYKGVAGSRRRKSEPQRMGTNGLRKMSPDGPPPVSEEYYAREIIKRQ